MAHPVEAGSQVVFSGCDEGKRVVQSESKDALETASAGEMWISKKKSMMGGLEARLLSHFALQSCMVLFSEAVHQRNCSSSRRTHHSQLLRHPTGAVPQSVSLRDWGLWIWPAFCTGDESKCSGRPLCQLLRQRQFSASRSCGVHGCLVRQQQFESSVIGSDLVPSRAGLRRTGPRSDRELNETSLE